MIGPDFFKARPDQVTTERLQEARAVVGRVCELDPASIDSLTLAERLQGLSRAVSDIVLAKGAEVVRLTEAPNYDPAVMPETLAANVWRHFADPKTRTGHSFLARPDERSVGASMSVIELFVDHRKDYFVYEASIPTDRMLDEVLMQEPALWSSMEARSSDFRSGQCVQAYPFNARFYEEDAPAQYLGVVQELATELLALTA